MAESVLVFLATPAVSVYISNHPPPLAAQYVAWELLLGVRSLGRI